ncbi:MAG: cupin domain-containing protein [Bacteroidia bacterium]|nr:cupin domain-containing protein [Bacteroidia bacterium]
MAHHFNHKDAEWKAYNVKGFSGSEIINLPNGTLKYVKVEANSVFPTHLHVDKLEFAVVVEGTATLTVDTNSYIAKVGEVVKFPEKTNHAIANHTNHTLILLVGAINTEE